VGRVDGSNIIFSDINTTPGGKFSDPENKSTVQELPWGSLELELNCEEATATYVSSEEGFGEGTYLLGRLTNIDQLACP
jgi:hypothetical protein